MPESISLTARKPVIVTGLESSDIDPKIIDTIATQQCGAVVSFEGRIRDHNEGRTVLSLFYEAYEKRATTQLSELAFLAADKYELGGVIAIHRTGNVALGEIAVLIATSSPHRSNAFDATRWLIDEIKSSVAIWKKETYANGSDAWLGIPNRAPDS